MKKVFIFGLGHLGKKVVSVLESSSSEYKISATYRDLNRVLDYQNYNLFKFCVGDDIPILGAQDEIIFNFPPVQGYLEFLKSSDEMFDPSTAWTFISSTSVFGSGMINEDSEKNGQKKNSHFLIQLEDFLLSLKRRVRIIRPGGLIDEQRLPGKFLKFKDKLLDSEREINFIHTDDVARFIEHSISNNLNGEYNIVSDTPLKRREIYLREHPELVCDNLGLARKISNEKVKQTGYKFKHLDLRDFLGI